MIYFFVVALCAVLVAGFYFLAAYKIIDFSPGHWFRKEALIKSDESLYLNQEAPNIHAPSKPTSSKGAGAETHKPVYEKNDREYLDKLLQAK